MWTSSTSSSTSASDSAAPASTRPCRRCSGLRRRRRPACSPAPPAAARALAPSQSAKSDTSSPSSSSSTRNGWPSASAARSAASSSSCVWQTQTPLPAASPSAFTTHGGRATASVRARRDAGRVHHVLRERLRALDPRGRARSARRRRRPRWRSSSARPATSGASGPDDDEVDAELGARAARATPGRRPAPGGTSRARRSRGFPGAACSSSSRALRASAHASACSRPPTRRRAPSRGDPRRLRGRRPQSKLPCMEAPPYSARRSTSSGCRAARSERDLVAVEEPLEIRIGGEPVAVTMRTPGHDEELALGFCLSEGLQPPRRALPDDLAANTVEVDAPGFDPARLQRSFYTSSSCGVCGKGALEAVAVEAPRVESELRVPLAARRRRCPTGCARRRRRSPRPAACTRRGSSPRTASCSARARTSAGTTRSTRSSAGRSAPGCCRSRDAVLCVSGRLSFELVQKAAVAGCPMLVAVGAPSSLAVELAADRGVTLCGFVRGGRVNVYTEPWRDRALTGVLLVGGASTRFGSPKALARRRRDARRARLAAARRGLRRAARRRQARGRARAPVRPARRRHRRARADRRRRRGPARGDPRGRGRDPRRLPRFTPARSASSQMRAATSRCRRAARCRARTAAGRCRRSSCALAEGGSSSARRARRSRRGDVELDAACSST